MSVLYSHVDRCPGGGYITRFEEDLHKRHEEDIRRIRDEDEKIMSAEKEAQEARIKDKKVTPVDNERTGVAFFAGPKY